MWPPKCLFITTVTTVKSTNGSPATNASPAANASLLLPQTHHLPQAHHFFCHKRLTYHKCITYRATNASPTTNVSHALHIPFLCHNCVVCHIRPSLAKKAWPVHPQTTYKWYYCNASFNANTLVTTNKPIDKLDGNSIYIVSKLHLLTCNDLFTVRLICFIYSLL